MPVSDTSRVLRRRPSTITSSCSLKRSDERRTLSVARDEAVPARSLHLQLVDVLLPGLRLLHRPPELHADAGNPLAVPGRDHVHHHRVRRDELAARHRERDPHQLPQRRRRIGAQERAAEADVVRHELDVLAAAHHARHDSCRIARLSSLVVRRPPSDWKATHAARRGEDSVPHLRDPLNSRGPERVSALASERARNRRPVRARDEASASMRRRRAACDGQLACSGRCRRTATRRS